MSCNDRRMPERITQIIRGSLWAIVALTLASRAHAQTAGLEKALPEQMERGVTLSSPSLPPSLPDLTKALQAELNRVGCFEGAIDGVWGEKTKVGLMEFVRRTKTEVPTGAPTTVSLEAVSGQRDRVCPLACGAGRIERSGQCVAQPAPAPTAAAKPARPQPAVEGRRPREKAENERPSSGMCWRNDGRGTSLVPCNEAPTGRRAY